MPFEPEGQIDFPRLADWMRDQGLGDGHIEDARALGGGTQNIVVRFRRGRDSYVIRRPPLHKRGNSDETMLREARVLAALDGSDVPHAPLAAVCSDRDVLGCAFYLTLEVEGFNPRQELIGDYATRRSWRRELGLAMADTAAAIGRFDYASAGLADLGRPTGFLVRQVTRWNAQLKSYESLGTYKPAIPHVDEVGDWLQERVPTSTEAGLIHGDFHLANVLCARKHPRIQAVVDWELCTIGDPLLDLGWLIATWPDERGPGQPGTIGAEPWDGFPSAGELIERYALSSTRDLSQIVWYEVLACYKLAVIVEGTYARALAGKASMDVGVKLHQSAVALLTRASQRILSLTD